MALLHVVIVTCVTSIPAGLGCVPSFLSLILALGWLHPKGARLLLELLQVKPVLSFPSRNLGRAERSLRPLCAVEHPHL